MSKCFFAVYVLPMYFYFPSFSSSHLEWERSRLIDLVSNYDWLRAVDTIVSSKNEIFNKIQIFRSILFNSISFFVIEILSLVFVAIEKCAKTKSVLF